MTEVRGKVVIVTGASSGVGEASARCFGAAGAKVVLAARRVQRLEAVAKEIRSEGSEALVVPVDITRLEDIRNLVERTMGAFGQIDVLFNNAGFGRIDWLENLDPIKDIDTQYKVNVLGVVQVTREALPIMIRQRSGHVINMASMGGFIATPTYSVYASCKFAVRGFSEALRREVAPWGINVSALYPGGVETEFGKHALIERKTKASTPRWLVLSAEDVAQHVLGLAHRPRAELVIPWPYRISVWLNQWVPWLVDWSTIHGFTIPERIDELRQAGLR